MLSQYDYSPHDQNATTCSSPSPSPSPVTSSSAPPSSSTHSSLTPRLSLQSLTNFIPTMPWSPMAAAAGPVQAATASIPPSSSPVIDQRHPRIPSSLSLSQRVMFQQLSYKANQPGFVSREQQLAKLRLRLQQERGMGMKIGTGLCVDVCKKCNSMNDKIVSL
ncbi:hypothetical protein AX16_000139 [Volvariella volvacea WC 439]|nr:hypothetical protein AX16_000139 [Volvariella volvacea WC 439]